MSSKKNLTAAKLAKKDEYYTRREDIDEELRHYERHFNGAVVYCNCDDPWRSNFFKYFAYNFRRLKLKKIITTCYRNQSRDLFSQNESERAVSLEYNGFREGETIPDPETIGVRQLEGDGDFRSPECEQLLREADIVVTNPPFSLFRSYITQLMTFKKRFLVLGNMNALSYADIFPYFQTNQLWYGWNSVSRFVVPDKEEYKNDTYDPATGTVKFGNICWFTNLDHEKRHQPITLYKTYNPTDYPSYDNYPAIEVAHTSHIPADYMDVMGVPISFMSRYSPDQFEILGLAKAPFHTLRNKVYPRQIQVDKNGKESWVTKLNDQPAIELQEGERPDIYYKVDGKRYAAVYARILIRRKGADQ